MDISGVLRDKIIELEQRYEGKIAELSLVKELGSELTKTSLSMGSQLFLNQLDIVKQHTGIYSVSIMLVDEESEKLYVVSASGMCGMPRCQPIRLKRGEGIAGRVIEIGRTLYIPDVTEDPTFCDRGTKQKGSLACVPIISEGRCIGVLNFRDNQPQAFAPNDLRVFELVADQLSITTSLVRAHQDLMNLEKKRINLSRYFSRGLAEHLVADERMTRLGGDMKKVSIVFADVTGFTHLVETHPVEQVVHILNQFFETVVPIIFRHGGMLDKFLGDGVMAVFGIPDSGRDDAARATACGVDIQRGVEDLGRRLEEEGLFPITVGVGIATGEVLAGNIGTEEQMNFTVIGEPVNLAQRLESVCEPGEVVVCEQTSGDAGDCGEFAYKLEPMGAIQVKGLKRDVHPRKVIYNG